MKRTRNSRFNKIASLTVSSVLLFNTVSTSAFSLFPSKAKSNATNVTMGIKEYPDIDIVLAKGKTQTTLTNFETDLKTALVAKGIPESKVKIEAIEANSITAETKFDWTKHDHNKGVVSGADVIFYGYPDHGYQDFWYCQTDARGDKTFSFVLNESQVNYHSFEGGGFLFGMKTYPDRSFEGYALLVNSSTISIRKIPKTNINSFNNAHSFTYGNPSGTGTFTVAKPSGVKHDIIMTVKNENHVNVNVNGRDLINFKFSADLPGRSFGLLADHAPHGCSQTSTFRWSNLTMETEVSKEFTEVLREPDWRDNATRYIVAVEDELRTDFDNGISLGEIISRMLTEDIGLIGWGSNVTRNQLETMVKRNGNNGTFFFNTDYMKAIDDTATYIYNQLNTLPINPYALINQDLKMEINPRDVINDTSNDEYPDGKWKVIHNYDYFDNNLGKIVWEDQYMDDMNISSIDKPGRYDFYYEDREVNPLSLYIHRRPIAEYKFKVDTIMTGSGQPYTTVTDFKFTGTPQTFMVPYSGTYQIEAWGAEGGNREGNATGGKGGYAKGIIELSSSDILNIYVGGEGDYDSRGYNGGGKSGYPNVYGGGATDVRIGGTDLLDRIIVAGGGGSVGAPNKPGGAGGGAIGESRTETPGTGGGGGTATTGGTGGNPAQNGTFGQGGDGINVDGGYGGAGGGGYWGGGGAYPDATGDDDRGGGGGSGFISNRLTSTILVDGTSSMRNPDGQLVMGHSGDGYVRITPVNVIAQNVSAYTIEYIDESLDEDMNISSPNDDGLYQREWKWRYSDSYVWNVGKPATLQPNKNYIIQLRVKDYQNTWSLPMAKFISTENSNLSPLASFVITPNPMTIYDKATVKDYSYDPLSREIVERQWEVFNSNGVSVYKGTTPLTSFKDLGVGKYTYQLTVKNSLGNWSEPFKRTVHVFADTTAPEMSVYPSSHDWTTEDIRVNVEFRDIGGSGFNSYRYVVSNSRTRPNRGWSNWIAKGKDNIFITTEARNYLHIECKDNDNNLRYQVVGTYNIDRTAPDMTYTLDKYYNTNQPVTITINAYDRGVGFQSVKLPDKNVIMSSKASFTVHENGIYYFELTDKLGNTKIVEVKVTNIDKTKPSLLEIIKNPNRLWTNKDTNVTINASDDPYLNGDSPTP